jgi:protein Tex
MAKTFVKDPRAVVKPGDIVRVKVLKLDAARRRITLTLRLDDEVELERARPPAPAARAENSRRSEGALADALRRAGHDPRAGSLNNRTRPR